MGKGTKETGGVAREEEEVKGRRDGRGHEQGVGGGEGVPEVGGEGPR